MPTDDILEAKRTLSHRMLLGDGPIAAGAALRRSRSRHVDTAAANADRNVHAIGVGRKLVDGKPTGERCVRIYVTQKVPKRLIARKALLPASIDGVPTDVIESAPAFAALPAPAACTAERLHRQRPLRGGISAAHGAVTAGTIACLCRSTDADDDPDVLLVLSNNHVFADLGAAAVGDDLLQPSRIDGGVAADRMATLLRAHPIDFAGGPNPVDAAVGALLPSVEALRSICSIGAVSGVAAPVEGMLVRKHGRTSGLSFGAVTDTSLDVVVGMDPDDRSVVATFVDQLRIDGRPQGQVFGLGGDSGSLVVTQAGRRAVGLYFAGPDSGLYGLANPIEAVLTALSIELA